MGFRKISYIVLLIGMMIAYLVSCDTTKTVVTENRYEAEDAILTDLNVDKKMTGFSGQGYISGFTNDTGSATFEIQAPESALYQLIIGYATPHGYKMTHLKVNDVSQGEVELQEIDGFSETPEISIFLEKGKNTITLEKSWGWYVIDYIEVRRPPNKENQQISKNSINPNASDEAKSLLSYLVDMYGEKILSGQQEYPNSLLADVQYIYTHTGKKPAILGLDFIDNSPSRVERGTSANETDVAIQWWQEEGGIVAFTWHWNAPKDLIDEPGKEWWRGFYTEATTFDIEYAMNHPQSEDYQLIVRDIDTIAEELKKLKEANVPVLWRPLHEAEGGWFWWGAKGPEPAKKLWKLMYERMTEVHELHHLLWVWNSVDEEWYPGDKFVDIVSFDSYPRPHQYSSMVQYYNRLENLVGRSKIVAMAENGPIPDPDLLESHQAHWSWFSTWNGEILREHNSIEHLQKVYQHDYVITLDELPNFK